MISKDEYLNWKNHPVTREYFKNLSDIIEDLIEAHLDGISIQEHGLLTHQIGLIRAYRSAHDYSPSFNDDGYMIDDVGDIIE